MTIDIQKMKARLETKLAELQTHMGDLNEIQTGSGGFIESGEGSPEFEESATDLAQRQLEQSIFTNELALLTEVQDALKRIAQGNYGFCTLCGRPIPEKRLEAVPWAARCVKDEEQLEMLS